MNSSTDTRTSFSFLFLMKNTLPGMLSAERSWDPPIIEWTREVSEERGEERRVEKRMGDSSRRE
jgi:hypothetical protein